MCYNHRLRAACVGLAVLLLTAPVRAADIDKLLPNDTETIAVVNVRQLLDSPLIKKLGLEKAKEAIKQQGEAQKILDELGFDLFRDLDTITAAGPGGAEADKGLLIIHGKFELDKLRTKLQALTKEKKDVVKAHQVPDGLGGNYAMYEVSVPDQPQTFFVSLASKTTILASPGKDYLIDALDKEAGRKKTTLKSKDMAALIGGLDAKQSMYIGVLGAALTAALEKSPLGNEDKAKEIIEKIAQVTFGLTIEKDILTEIGIGAKTTAAAKELEETIRDGLNQALLLATFLANNNKQLNPVVDLLKSIRPKVTDKNVLLKAEVSGEDLEKALSNR